eukprot:5378723-Pyramimonas_sp.AAC.1
MRALLLSEDLVLFLEDIHDGACILTRDAKTGRVVRRLRSQLGVRQGSCEGPLCFIPLYDLTIRTIQRERGDHSLMATFDSTLKDLLGSDATFPEQLSLGETAFMTYLS